MTTDPEPLRAMLEGAGKAWVRILKQQHPDLHFEVVIVDDDEGDTPGR